jgi:hypothetical protein
MRETPPSLYMRETKKKALKTQTPIKRENIEYSVECRPTLVTHFVNGDNEDVRGKMKTNVSINA